MRNKSSTLSNLAGSILIAAPTLKDPHFCKTILFLSHHNTEDGALGFILNRPLQKTVGEVATLQELGSFAPIPLFYGGPVAQQEVNIASLKWIEQPRSVNFKAFSNLSEATECCSTHLEGLRAFAGHASWYRDQLEQEIAQKVWFIVHPNRTIIDMPHPDSAWKDALYQISPFLKLLAGAPDDPSLN